MTGPADAQAAAIAETRTPILELEDIDYSYVSYPLFEHLNLTVMRGEAVLVLGEAGCGKTTLLRLILGLETPNKGRIRLTGKDTAGAGYRVEQEYRTRIGYVPEVSSLLANLSLFDNVALPLRYHRRFSEEEVQYRVRKLLAQFKVDRYQVSYPAAVSPMNRKLARLARAMILDPVLVLVDDLEDDLTPASCRMVLEILDQMKRERGTAFLLTGHSVRAVGGLVDKVAWLREHSLTPAEPYEEARKRGALESEF